MERNFISGAVPKGRLAITLFAILTFGVYAEAQTQTNVVQTPAKVALVPMRIFEQLMRPDRENRPVEQRIEALQALGVEGSEIADARLTFEDLDGDGIAEALFVVQLDGANDIRLVVLKRKGNDWYRLASPAEFSCWCKYEDSPLDTFAEIRPWGYGKDGPAKLLFVRGSGGGTGIYDRELDVYSLQGFELRHVFGVVEERRECPYDEPIECDINHTEVLPVNAPHQPPAVLALSYERKHFGGDFWNDTWWIGLPIHTCAAYTWNTQRRQFLENRSASLAYCGHLGTRPPVASTPTR